MSNKICLFGAGGHGRVVAAQIVETNDCADLCFGDQSKEVGSFINDIPVKYSEPEHAKDTCLIPTIGDNSARAQIYKRARKANIHLGTFISKYCKWYSEPPGAGSVALAGVIVTTDVVVGQGVILNSGAIIEHDCEIGDFCHIAPGSILIGGTKLGQNVFVGAGAKIVNSVKIASNTIIGAGTVVVSDINSPGVYVGAPARCIREFHTKKG